MSTNVIRTTKFQKVYSEKKEPKKVLIFPNLFSNLLKQYKVRQDELRQRKIDFLTIEAFKYFYDLLEFPKIADVDLPEFIYEEQRRKIAYQKASEAMLNVIAKKRVNQCYSARMKELKNRG